MARSPVLLRVYWDNVKKSSCPKPQGLYTVFTFGMYHHLMDFYQIMTTPWGHVLQYRENMKKSSQGIEP